VLECGEISGAASSKAVHLLRNKSHKVSGRLKEIIIETNKTNARAMPSHQRDVFHEGSSYGKNERFP